MVTLSRQCCRVASRRGSVVTCVSVCVCVGDVWGGGGEEWEENGLWLKTMKIKDHQSWPDL